MGGSRPKSGSRRHAAAIKAGPQEQASEQTARRMHGKQGRIPKSPAVGRHRKEAAKKIGKRI
jgi:hypothetical protein